MSVSVTRGAAHGAVETPKIQQGAAFLTQFKQCAYTTTPTGFHSRALVEVNFRQRN